jgi:hypothetical protein
MDEYINRTSILWALRLAKNCAIAKVVEEGGEYDKMPQTGKACYDGMVAAFDMCIKVVEGIESVSGADMRGEANE